MTTYSDDTVKRAIAEVRAAIENPGVSPAHHRRVMAQHRQQWPTLWVAIDRLMKVTDNPDYRRLDDWEPDEVNRRSAP